MTITHATSETIVTEADVERAEVFADAAQGLAGHQVTDPVLRGLARSAARGDISAEEAITRANAYIDGH